LASLGSQIFITSVGTEGMDSVWPNTTEVRHFTMVEGELA
jgi:DNA replication and repair protein RecF